MPKHNRKRAAHGRMTNYLSGLIEYRDRIEKASVFEVHPILPNDKYPLREVVLLGHGAKGTRGAELKQACREKVRAALLTYYDAKISDVTTELHQLEPTSTEPGATPLL